MFTKYHCIYSALIASLAVSACSSDAQKYEGRLAIEREACYRSGGSFDADEKIGGSSCNCRFDNGGIDIKCYQAWLCDTDNNTCRECVEGDVKCNKGEASVCVNGNWIHDSSQNKCPKEDIICESNKCEIDGQETEIISTADYHEIKEKSICDGDIECKEGRLFCDGNLMESCISGKCDENSNKCKPVEGISESTTCNQKNDSQCVAAGNKYIQLQCVESTWVKTNECDACSIDGKTCSYCDEKDYPKCDNGTLTRCQFGRLIKNECSNKQCKDDKTCADEAEPEPPKGCSDCPWKCENGVCKPLTEPECKGNETYCDGNILKKCENEEWHTMPCLAGQSCQLLGDGSFDCQEIVQPPECEKDTDCNPGEHCNANVCGCNSDEYKCNPKEKGNIDFIQKCTEENQWQFLNEEERNNWKYDGFSAYHCNEQNVCSEQIKGDNSFRDVCGECINDTKKCDGDNIQTCKNGSWGNEKGEEGQSDPCEEGCENDSCKSSSNPQPTCKDNTYQCGEDHILKCESNDGKGTIAVKTDMEKAEGCLTKQGDPYYYCQNTEQKNVNIEDACKCEPLSANNTVYCFNGEGYYCDSTTKMLENTQCVCKENLNNFDTAGTSQSSTSPQCYYRCKSDQYSCDSKGILRCEVNIQSDKIQVSNSNIVDYLNSTNETLLNNCLEIKDLDYLCEYRGTSEFITDGKCCTPEAGKLLCFAGKAYECTKDGRIDKATEKSCKACEGDDKNGTKVDKNCSSGSTETKYKCNEKNQLTNENGAIISQDNNIDQFCTYVTDDDGSFYLCSNKGEVETAKELCQCDPGYYCYGKKPLICSNKGKLEIGSNDDTSCCSENSGKDYTLKESNTQCTSCIDGYHRCSNSSSGNDPLSVVSQSQQCDANHKYNTYTENVLGIMGPSSPSSSVKFRFIDCSDNQSLSYTLCYYFKIGDSEELKYDLDLLSDTIRKGGDKITFSCTRTTRIPSIEKKLYYVYAVSSYSDNIGANVQYYATVPGSSGSGFEVIFEKKKD